MDSDFKWTDLVVRCPVCSGEVIGSQGNDFAHIDCAWIDDLSKYVVRGNQGFYMLGSRSGARGTEVGFGCWFEACHHAIFFCFRFHKGDVLVGWKEVLRQDGDSPEELPRT